MSMRMVHNFVTVINDQKKRKDQWGMPQGEYDVFCHNLQKRIDVLKDKGLLTADEAEMLTNMMKETEE